MPSSLLITRRRYDKIWPIYAQLNQENLAIARLIIKTYRDSVGRRKGELNQVIRELEELDYDYRYIRGLSFLLDRRCQLEPKATSNPVTIRRHVFKLANNESVPTTSESRRLIIERAASELGITVEELNNSFYGDLEDEFILKHLEPVDPEILVKQYNLSLTQTLLFNSTELNFTVTGNWQRIFRQIKWLGLIYTISKSDSEYEIRVDGPISLFKLTRRYGTNLAKLLPTIVQSQDWSIKAKVLSHRGERKLLNLELNSKKHSEYMGSIKNGEQETYDSIIEKDFANRFSVLNTGWTMTREPEPIPVGKQVIIPDFCFRKGGMVVYMEIVGFWTPQYLQEKIKKLDLLSNIDMIVAADKNLACEKLNRLRKRLNVVYYRHRVTLKPVLAHLKTKEKRLVKQQIRQLQTKSITIPKPVIEVKELAKMLGVLENTMKEIIREREIKGYIRVGDMLIKDSKLKEIQKKMKNRMEKGELSLEEAFEIITNAGVKRPTAILETLNYRIAWCGIDPRTARIYRKKS